MSTVLPFFAAQQALLRQLLAEGPNLHHALLLAGLPGIGKGEFARALAQGLLCEQLPRPPAPLPSPLLPPSAPPSRSVEPGSRAFPASIELREGSLTKSRLSSAE